MYIGSYIAKQIADDNKREAYQKAKALRMKKLKDEYEKRKRGKKHEEDKSNM